MVPRFVCGPQKLRTTVRGIGSFAAYLKGGLSGLSGRQRGPFPARFATRALSSASGTLLG